MARTGGGLVIEEMRMQGLGVIADAVLPLGAGFTAITGETGAGKTMVVTGLGLLLGQRADSGACLLYTSPSPRDRQKSRMPSSA